MNRETARRWSCAWHRLDGPQQCGRENVLLNCFRADFTQKLAQSRAGLVAFLRGCGGEKDSAKSHPETLTAILKERVDEMLHRRPSWSTFHHAWLIFSSVSFTSIAFMTHHSRIALPLENYFTAPLPLEIFRRAHCL
jgi:hypothetical protein